MEPFEGIISALEDDSIKHDLRRFPRQLKLLLGFLEGDYRTDPKTFFRGLKRAKIQISFVSELIRRYKEGIHFQPERVPFSSLADSVRKTSSLFLLPSARLFFESNLSERNAGREMGVDAFAIRRAVFNLVGNALRATAQAGSVRVTLSLGRNRLKITVSDTGRGMPRKEVEEFYSRGYITAGGRKEFGLANVKEIAKLHKGSVGIKSAEGKGTTVSIEIPVK